MLKTITTVLLIALGAGIYTKKIDTSAVQLWVSSQMQRIQATQETQQVAEDKTVVPAADDMTQQLEQSWESLSVPEATEIEIASAQDVEQWALPPQIPAQPITVDPQFTAARTALPETPDAAQVASAPNLDELLNKLERTKQKLDDVKW